MGAQSILKLVTNPKPSPPSTPHMMKGIAAAAGSNAPTTRDHTHAAGTTTRNRRNAVLLTVPSTVIASPAVAVPYFSNTLARNAGFLVRNAMENTSFGRAPLI